LSVLTEEQIIKLRRIAVGILPLSAFTADELLQLDRKQKSQFAWFIYSINFHHKITSRIYGIRTAFYLEKK
jgi:hypothetical protein